MEIDELIAQRIAHLRNAQDLSLGQLAERSGVSKGMISKIERQESSPTASVLGRLAAGLGVPLSDLLADGGDTGASALRRRGDQETWRDPATGYIRRQVAELDPASGSELIEIELPAGARIDYPQWHTKVYRQRLWVLEGELELRYGDDVHRLAPGDRIDFAVDKPLSYAALKKGRCRYLLNVLHG